MARRYLRVRKYVVLDASGRELVTTRPGLFGGHRRLKIFGRLDCWSALAAIRRGKYVAHRVFFLDEATARAAGYRPCAKCLPAKYAAWKAARR